MKNKITTTKTILFAGLIAAMILPFSMVDYAQAQKATYNPDMVSYLTEVMATDGTMIQEKTLDEKTYKVKKNVTLKNNGNYKVVNSVFIDGEKITKEVFVIKPNEDGTITLVNKGQDTSETFTDVEGPTTRGIGYSSPSGAAIVLNDGETGTPYTVNLYDSFNACWNFNQAVMEADVKTSVVDVNWEASPFYLHSCFQPHQWEHGFVEFDGSTYQLDSGNNQSDRKSSHAFTNTIGGNAYYEVEAMFFYGAW